ncbi:hypothetical protein [Bordetella petrii]|uniref:hypothetical protein n=1 Tax=Bordetella petrii TaxID=94624 RepID=UPI00048BF884|nr:hypothetical protein [Bordetella petrii]
MADNKQTVLTDEEIQDIADGFDIYGARPEFARAIESAVLSKLRATNEPAAYVVPGPNGTVLFGKGWMFSSIPVGNAQMPLYSAPQASAEESAIDKPIPDSVEHYGLIDERVGAPAAEDSAKGAGDVVAWTNDAGDIEPISDAVKQARPDLYAKHYTRPLAFADRQQRGGDAGEPPPITARYGTQEHDQQTAFSEGWEAARAALAATKGESNG